MTILTLIKRIPSFAIDVKINLNEVFSEDIDGVSKAQTYGIALTSAYVLRHEQLLNDVRSEAKIYLEDTDAQACKIAAVTMSMNSTYHTFSENIKSTAVSKIKLDASNSAIQDLKVEEVDFAFYSLAAAILYSCPHCIQEYSNILLKYGFSSESIAKVAKLVSVLRSAAIALEIESVRSYDFIVREENF